jgi:hypothetical protein
LYGPPPPKTGKRGAPKKHGAKFRLKAPLFRFLKQHLGLLAAHVADLTAISHWMWVVALAYRQLLLAHALVGPQYRPWDPAARRNPARSLTPGQVRQAWGVFSHGLGTPAAAPRPAGKAPGRAVGFHPKPRQRHPVVKKGQAMAKAAA